MKKKYQVFVSSTFLDLKAERQAAVEAILLAGHIPAGMELFSAGDESQLEVIKKWIEASDIYMVILGGRYGSIEAKSGLSYIEVEYDHATAMRKPLFALVLDEGAVNRKAIENSSFSENMETKKLEIFRKKVLSKISRTVEDHKDVKLYTMEAIKNIEDSRPDLMGWIRADEAVDTAPVLEQITALTKSNGQLRAQIKELEKQIPAAHSIPDLAGLDTSIVVNGEYKNRYDGPTQKTSFTLTLGAVFGLIAPKLLESPNDSLMRRYIGDQIFNHAKKSTYSHSIEEQDFQTIKIQLTALNLVEVTYAKTVKAGMALFWELTDLGKKELIRLRALRK